MMHSHLRRLTALPFGLLCLLSCGGRLDTSDEDNRATGGASGAAGEPGDSPARCDQEHGKMVLLGSGATRFCIDAAPVTEGDYATFLREEPAALASCSGSDFEPCFLGRPDDAQAPVGCVDYCHAEAYCTWAGKRLCGLMGGSPLGQDSRIEQTEWYFACSNGGSTDWPYGDAYIPGRCVEPRLPLLPVDRSPNLCRGTKSPFDELVDMVGQGRTWVAGTIYPDGTSGSRSVGAESCHVSYLGRTPAGIRCCDAPIVDPR